MTNRRRHTFLTPVSLLVLLATVAPAPGQATHAQGESLHADLAVRAIQFQDVIMDRPNAITVLVDNHGPDASAGSVELYWDAVDNPTGLVGRQPVNLKPSETASVQFQTDGRTLSGADQTEAIRFVARVTAAPGVSDPSSSNDQAIAPVQVKRYGLSFDLSGSPNFNQRATHLTPARYTFHVTNTGNSIDTVRLTVLPSSNAGFGSGQAPRPDWTYAFQQETMVIAAGERRANHFFVAPSEAALHRDSTIVAVQIESVGNPDVTQKRDAPNTSVARVAGVRIDSLASANVNPDDRAFLDLTLTNTGNGDDAFALTAGAPGAGWTVQFPDANHLSQVEVPAHQTRTVRIIVYAPADAPAGNHNMVASARSISPDGDQRQDQRATTLRVAQRAGLTVQAVSATQSTTDPFEPAPYVFRVTNAGNGADTFAFAAQTIPAGWNATFSPPEAILAMGEMVEVTARITPAAGATAGAYDSTLRIRSALDPQTARTIPITTNVRPAYGVFVTVPIPERGVEAGQTVEVPFVIQNTGNRDDQVNISLAAPATTRWTASFARHDLLTSLSANLTRGTTATRTVFVTSPWDLGATEQVELQLIGRSVGSSLAKTHQVPIFVGARAADLVVDQLTIAPQPAYAGESTYAHIRVRNIGDKPVLQPFDVTVHLQRIDQGEGAPPITVQPVPQVAAPLDPGAAAELTVLLPTANLSGTYRVTAHADKLRLVQERMDETSGTQNNIANQTLTIRLVRPVVEAPQGPGARTGETLLFSAPGGFRIRNQGDSGGAFLLQGTSDAGWLVDVQPASVMLAPGAQTNVTVRLHVPPNVDDVRATNVTLRAVLDGHTGISNQNATRVLILDDQPPNIGLFQIQADSHAAGQPVRFVADVTDNARLSNVAVHLDGPDDDNSIVVMVPLTTGSSSYEATHVFTRAGRYLATLEAKDTSNNRASSPDPAAAFDVLAHGQVTVTPSGWGDGGRVQTGRFLNLSVNSTAPIVHAVQSLDGSPEIPIPADGAILKIGTTTLTDGVHALRVMVRTETGSETTRNFTFETDGTAPSIASATMDPPVPRRDQAVKVRVVSLDADIESVALILHRWDKEPVRHALTQAAPSTYVATFTVDAAFDEVVVEVKDDVGNAATATPGELLVLLEAPEVAKSPGWTIVGTLAGLAIAVARAGRRRDRD